MDPLATKYPFLSGYNYVAGNPIILADIDGRVWKIKTTDNGEEFQTFIKNCFDDKVVANINENNEITLKFTEDNNLETLNTQEKELHEALMFVIENGVTSMTAISEGKQREKVMIGDWTSSTIDLEDMESLGYGKYGESFDAQSALTHEVAEQYEKQNVKPDYERNHAIAHKKSNKVSGLTFVLDIKDINTSYIDKTKLEELREENISATEVAYMIKTYQVTQLTSDEKLYQLFTKSNGDFITVIIEFKRRNVRRIKEVEGNEVPPAGDGHKIIGE